MLQGEHSAILSTFIKLLIVIKIFVLSIFDWPFKAGFTVLLSSIGSDRHNQTFQDKNSDYLLIHLLKPVFCAQNNCLFLA